MTEPITAVELTKTDLCILDSYTCLAKGLSEYLGTGYEIVVQSLGNPDEGVICIMNGHYTGRKIGAPITDFALEMFERIKSHDGPPYATYFTENKNGEPIRSTTIAIHGENHRVIGFICINFFLNLPLATFIRENYFSEHLRVFSETFAAIAMAHYALASGDKGYAEKAVNLFKQVLHYKNTPGLLEPKFREGLVAKGHSFCMILIDTAARIREAINDPILTQQIDDSIAELRRDFMHPEFKAILETVGPNGEFIDSIAGRTINPGHSIETAWFILEEAKYRGWDPQLKEMGLQILNWSWDWGWDKTYGGINYFKDCKNFPPQEYWHDMKFWWPQCEAVIATLYAYQATGDAKYLEMHKLINDYTFNHLPDKEYGEWYGYLHFDGSVSQSAKGNLFKGPFHIPRMLLKCSLLCDEILSK